MLKFITNMMCTMLATVLCIGSLNAQLVERKSLSAVDYNGTYGKNLTAYYSMPKADLSLSYLATGSVSNISGYNLPVGTTYVSGCIDFTAGQMSNYVGGVLHTLEIAVPNSATYMSGLISYKIWIKTALDGPVVYEEEVTPSEGLTFKVFELAAPYTITAGPLVIGYTAGFTLTAAGPRYPLWYEAGAYQQGAFNAMISTSSTGHGEGAAFGQNTGGALGIVGYVTGDPLPANDLSVNSVSSPALKWANNQGVYAVSIYNAGTASQDGYQVQLLDGSNNILVSQYVNTALAAGAFTTVNLNYTPAMEGNLTVKGKVVLAGDENPSNDVSDLLTQTVYPLQPMAYCDNSPIGGVGTNSENVLHAAIGYPAASMTPYVGKNLTAIEFAISNISAVSGNITVWIRSALAGSDLYSQTVTAVQGWNSVILNTPYVLTDADTYIGYTLSATHDYPLGTTDNTQNAANGGHLAIDDGTWATLASYEISGNNAVIGVVENAPNQQYAVNYNTPANGTLSVTAGGNPVTSGTMVDAGTVITITATPNLGYILQSLTVNGNPFTSGNTHIVNATTTIACAFAEEGSEECNPPTNLAVNYTANCEAELTWDAPAGKGKSLAFNTELKNSFKERDAFLDYVNNFEPRTKGEFIATLQQPAIEQRNQNENQLQEPTRGTFVEDVEAHPDFAINSNIYGWSYIDGDNSNTYSIEGYIYPGKYGKMAFMAFNPSATIPALEGADPNSGQKYFACFAATDVANNDWIISPLLTEPTHLSFWAKAYSYAYQERMKVGYSTTGTAQSDFTFLTASPYVVVPAGAWTKYDYDIPAGAKYIAINCVSDDAYILMVDDITIEQEGDFGFTTYNVYRDDALIASNLLATSYTDEGFSVTDGHTWEVRVVCAGDTESVGVQVEKDPCIDLNACNPPNELVVTYSEDCDEAELTWLHPDSKWIKHCTSDVVTSAAGHSEFTGEDMTAAIRFTPSDFMLTGISSGFPITKIALGIGTNMANVNSMEIRIWEGGTSVADPGVLVYTQPITGYTSFTENQMAEITLDVPYIIDATKELRIGWNLVNTAGYPFGRDAGPTVSGKGILFICPSLNDGLWVDAAVTYEWNLNWSMKAFVDGGGGETALYNVYLNDVEIATDVAATSYLATDFDENATHTWSVSHICESEESDKISVTTNSCICFDPIIGTSTTTAYDMPVNTYWKYSYIQHIYTAEEIGGAGLISSVSFQYIYSQPNVKDNQTYYLGYTTKDVFESTSDWIPLSELTKVFSGNLVYDNANEWFTITFDTPFEYNQPDCNLVLAVLNNHGNYTTSYNYTFRVSPAVGNQTLCRNVDGTTPIDPATVPSGILSTNRSNTLFGICKGVTLPACNPPSNLVATYDYLCNEVKLTWTPEVGGLCKSYNIYRDGDLIAPGVFGTSYADLTFDPLESHTWEVTTVCPDGETTATSAALDACDDGSTLCDKEVIGTGATGSYQIPVNTYYNYSYVQQIFLPEEIGEAGEITELAFRYIYGTPTTKNPLTIYLGNTTKSTFTVNNGSEFIPLSQMQEVFTGSVTFSNGWVVIEFDTPFEYIGCNLVVAVLNNNGSYDTGNSSTFYVSPAGSDRTIHYYKLNTPAGAINPNAMPTSGGTYALSANRSNTVFKICDRAPYEAEVPVATAATNLTCNSFEANWNPVDGADNYLLSVYSKDVEKATVLTEDFSGITAGNDYDVNGSSSQWTGGNANFPSATIDRVYQAGGAVRLGYGSGSGTMTTKEMDLSGGTVTVNFSVKGWTTIENTHILVSIDGGTPEEVHYTALMSNPYEQHSITFPAATASSTVTFATSYRRAFIDNIVITVDEAASIAYLFEDLAVNNTTYPVIDLDPATTYYYYVKAVKICLTSEVSNEIDATTIPLYDIVSSAGTNGTITPNGTVTTCGLTEQTFIFDSDYCYEIDEVLINGIANEQAAEDGEYTFYNISQNQTISVTFKKTMYTVTASSGENGNITPSGDIELDCGTTQTFTFTPAACYEIAEVLINGESNAAAKEAGYYTFTDLDDDHTVEVSFTIKTFDIAVTTCEAVTITPTGPVEIINCGESATFNFEIDEEGYEIYELLIDGVNMPNYIAGGSYTFENISTSHSIEIKCRIITYSIVAVNGPNGTITPIGVAPVEYGDEKEFCFEADPNFEIFQLLIDGVNQADYVGLSSGCYTFENVTENHAITVTFKPTDLPPAYIITATADANGTITPSGLIAVNPGVNQTFTFTANSGYQIFEVLIDGVNDPDAAAAGTYTFADVDDNHNIHVTFAALEAGEYIIHTTYGQGGTISPNGIVYVTAGADQTFLITPKQGYKIDRVWVDEIENPQAAVDGFYTFTNVQGEHWLTATFTYISTGQYYITASVSTVGGTISPSGKVLVNTGDDRTFTFTPQAGYKLKEVLIDGINDESAVAAESYTFSDITSAHTIVGKFEKRNYIITSSIGTAGGTITPIGDVSVLHGGNKAYTITTQTGYMIDKVLIDGVENPAAKSSGKYTFSKVSDNHSIVVNFTYRTYIITATSGTGGMINPDGILDVMHGSSITYTIVPDATHIIKSVLINGKNNAAAVSSGTYTFTNVTAKQTIAATFALKSNAETEYGEEGDQLTLYPNPTTGAVNIESGELKVETIQVFDMLGRKVLDKKAESVTTHKIDLTLLPSGIYLVKVKTDTDVITRKIVKQ